MVGGHEVAARADVMEAAPVLGPARLPKADAIPDRWGSLADRSAAMLVLGTRLCSIIASIFDFAPVDDTPADNHTQL